MLNFFKKNILNDKEGINGFITILFTAIFITLFEIIFFINIGLKDVKAGINSLQNKLKLDIDEKLLGNDKYCNFLYNSIRTKHSNDIFDKFCKNKKNKKTKQEYNLEYNELLSSLKKSSTSNDLIAVLNGTDLKTQTDNISNVLKSVSSISDPELLLSSLYDYYRSHPEIGQSNNVVKQMLQNKYNTEITRNAWELFVFIIAILLTIIFMFNMSNISNKIEYNKVMWNFAFISACIAIFQINFFYNVAKKYQYEGNDTTEIIDYYIKSSRK